MKKIKIGFFKRPQGVFSKDATCNIEKKLKKEENVEVFTALDFRKAHIINGKAYVDDFCLNDLDIYFWHDTVKPSDWRGDNYYLNVLKALEIDCIVINTAESVKVVSDKYLSHLKLKEENLPVADFALVEIDNLSGAEKIMDLFGGSVLVKPRFGGWGIGIMRIDSKSQFVDFIGLLKSFIGNKKEQILIEKYYPNDISKWISVVVIGEHVFGYRKKILTDSEWKIYDPNKIDGKGEFSEYIDPPAELKEISLKAKKLIGKDIIGFDFIYTEDGYKIIDENGRPGIYPQCLKGANINIEDVIVELILSKKNEF